MTPEQIEIHRKRFEELEIASGESICWDDCDNLYWRDSQNQRWRGYLLFAQNLEIQPENRKNKIEFGGDYTRKCDDGN